MKDKTISQEQEDKLKKLKEKTSDPEVKAAIEKKLKQGNKPFNK
ncbi:hypothetical protein [Mucilaginibacter sp.]|jgi:hypothetical protein